MVTHFLIATSGPPIWAKGLTAVIAPLNIYFELAGTYHLMEAFALCWGLRLPPSFDNPFLRNNIAEFWKHWNITITSFFRDYLFFNRWGLSKPNLYLNTMLLFIALGLWHAFNWYWGVWGALQGLGFCVYLAWRNLQRGAPQNQHPSRHSWIIGAACTYLFLCITIYLPSKIVIGLREHVR
jgi:alginate O-acetyltransferase complex protein AlgI